MRRRLMQVHYRASTRRNLSSAGR